MSWNKTHSKALEEKVARIKSANQELREQLKAKDKKIAELEEEIVSEDIVFDIKESIAELKSIQSNDCIRCQGFVRDDYCSIIDDDCRVVMERCNGCRQFIPKEQ